MPGRLRQASYGATRGSFNIDVVLQALAEEGLVTIMAEPNLTARSGEPATFLAGGEYPYQTVSDNGTNTEFKDFGIGLNFTPDGDRRQPDQPRSSAPRSASSTSPRAADVPSLNTRRAETTVDLASGQSFAIAGLMENSSSQNASRMPGLGTIPVLGALFRSSAFQRGQSELVIIVTPVIVNPTGPPRRRDPGRHLRAAERLRAHPARPLPGQPARTRCRTASATAGSSASPASCSSEAS